MLKWTAGSPSTLLSFLEVLTTYGKVEIDSFIASPVRFLEVFRFNGAALFHFHFCFFCGMLPLVITLNVIGSGKAGRLIDGT